MNITDTCKCGATFRMYSGSSDPFVLSRVQIQHKDWLAAHEHCRMNLFVTTTYKPAEETNNG